MDTLADELGAVPARSAVVDSAPIGPSTRRYANAAVLLHSACNPQQLLDSLHKIESRFGRERRGQRWRARMLDLDIVLWSGGIVREPELKIPHPRYRERSFVLGPAATLAPRWRDPITGFTLRQLHARLTRPRPLPR